MSLGPRAPGQEGSGEWLFDVLWQWVSQRLACKVSLEPDGEGRPRNICCFSYKCFRGVCQQLLSMLKACAKAEVNMR